MKLLVKKNNQYIEVAPFVVYCEKKKISRNTAKARKARGLLKEGRDYYVIDGRAYYTIRKKEENKRKSKPQLYLRRWRRR